jgi:DNA-binding NtrC family response regulator
LKENRTGVIAMKTTNTKPEARKLSHILVAEDDTEMRELLAMTLRAEGYTVTECVHGAELAKNLAPIFAGKVSEFDLVVSDIRMPGVTGLEVLEGVCTLKKCPPVILITAFGNPETHELAKSYGAAAILDKPFELERLVAEVDRVLNT